MFIIIPRRSAVFLFIFNQVKWDIKCIMMKTTGKQRNKNNRDLLFSELPAFASYIKENYLDDFVEEQLSLSRELQLPMLSHFQISDEELKAASKKSSTELLICLIENRAAERIVEAQMRWVENKIGLLKQDQVTTEDITLSCYIQKQAFLKLLPNYTKEPSGIFAIIKELDRYYVQVETASTNTYVQILKNHLGQQEKQLLEAQALAHVGNWVWDIENQKLKWTDELFRIYGLEPQSEVTNEEIRKFNHPDDSDFIKQQLEEANRNNAISDFIYRIILKDGTLKYLHARGETQKDESGTIVKMFGTLQDITKQKETENELIEAKEFLVHKNMELQQSNTNLEEFAYIASHDLKEPLRKISILADKLIATKEEQLSERGQGYLTKIMEASVRMQGMINDLLSVSTITGDREFENHSLQAILEEVLITLEFKIDSQKAIIKTDDLPAAEVNVAQFRQLFQNIVSNSLKFSKRTVAPEILIEHRFLTFKQVKEFNMIKAKRYLEIKFTDNGIGFQNEYANKIFSIFKRLHSRTEYEGSGIGLSICKKIVENHSGVIYALGKPDMGATFIIIIPMLS